AEFIRFVKVFFGHFVKNIAFKMNGATLPSCTNKLLLYRRVQTFVSLGNDELRRLEPSSLEVVKKIQPVILSFCLRNFQSYEFTSAIVRHTKIGTSSFGDNFVSFAHFNIGCIDKQIAILLNA